MAPGVIRTLSRERGDETRAEYNEANRCRRVGEPRIGPYTIFVEVFRGGSVLGSSHRATKSSIDMDATHVSAIFSTPGVVSYLSIH